MQTTVRGLEEGRKLIQSDLRQVLLITQLFVIFILYLYTVRESSLVARRRNNTYREVLDMGYTARVRFPAWQDFSLLLGVQTGSGAQPASYPMGSGGDFPGVEWSGHEADHSPASSAVIKKGGAIPPVPHMS
jgi:hypothetical protein